VSESSESVQPKSHNPASGLSLFEYEDHDVRSIMIDGQPWFAVVDVCEILGLRNVSDALSRVNEADIDSVDLWSEANNRSYATRVVNESGLYDLILDSRKPEARWFRRWITAELLPSIRRTGSYVPGSFADALELAAKQQRAIEAQAAQLAIAAPKAEQFDRWQAAPDSVYVVEWAKKFGLTQAEGYEVLQQMNVIFKQRSADGGKIQAAKVGYEQHFESVREWLPGPRKWVPVLKIRPSGQVLCAQMFLDSGLFEERLIEHGWIAL
jgi:prophage antirepressor-like protein